MVIILLIINDETYVTFSLKKKRRILEILITVDFVSLSFLRVINLLSEILKQRDVREMASISKLQNSSRSLCLFTCSPAETLRNMIHLKKK